MREIVPKIQSQVWEERRWLSCADHILLFTVIRGKFLLWGNHAPGNNWDEKSDACMEFKSECFIVDWPGLLAVYGRYSKKRTRLLSTLFWSKNICLTVQKGKPCGTICCKDTTRDNSCIIYWSRADVTQLARGWSTSTDSFIAMAFRPWSTLTGLKIQHMSSLGSWRSYQHRRLKQRTTDVSVPQTACSFHV